MNAAIKQTIVTKPDGNWRVPDREKVYFSLLITWLWSITVKVRDAISGGATSLSRPSVVDTHVKLLRELMLAALCLRSRCIRSWIFVLRSSMPASRSLWTSSGLISRTNGLKTWNNYNIYRVFMQSIWTLEKNTV